MLATVFGPRRMTSFTTGYSVAVTHFFARMLWPADSEPLIRYHRESHWPRVTKHGAHVEYAWSLASRPAILSASEEPAWFDPYPWIQVTDFGSWGDVVAWALPLYAVDATAPAEVRDIAARIARAHPTAIARAEAALRYVQDEIRYLGIEIGEYSHRPSRPETVLERRFGDCKDKTVLLTALLRELGLDAAPALVHTRTGRALLELAPSPLVFDHVIVHLRVDDRDLWLDPTRLYERGPLEQYAGASFGAALLVRPGSNVLTEVPEPALDEPLTDVRVALDLRNGDGPVTMNVETTFLGLDADATRYSHRSRSVESIAKGYLDFYGTYYPSIEATEPPKLSDDEVANRVIVRERYVIPEFWTSSQEPGATAERRTADFFAAELRSYLDAPATLARTSPLAQAHPIHLRYRIDAAFEPGWEIEPDELTIESRGARLGFRSEVQDRTLRLTWELRSLADHVSPEHTREHAARLEEMRGATSYPVRFSVDVASSGSGLPQVAAASAIALRPGQGLTQAELNWPIALVALLTVWLTSLAAARIYRVRPAVPAELQASVSVEGEVGARAWPRPRGLAGWLIVIGAMVLLMPLVVGLRLHASLPTYSLEAWHAMTTPGGEAYRPGAQPALLLELVAGLVALVLSLAAGLLYFLKKRAFPRLFVALLALVGVALELLAVGRLTTALGDTEATVAGIGRAILGALGVAIWWLYILMSRRVRNTFVH